MRHFFANFIAMFFVSKKLRRRIRAKIMQSDIAPKNTESSPQPNTTNDNTQEQLLQLEKKINYLRLKSDWLAHNNDKLLLPARFSEYDLIIAIGATCHATTILDMFNLRRFSSPFQWTGGMVPATWNTVPDVYRDSRFREKIYALTNNFEDWLNPKYFKYVSQWVDPCQQHHNVVNTKIKIRFIHEFPNDQDIIQHMPEFTEKMQRRMANLYKAMDKSQNILVLWLSCIWDQQTLLEKNVSDKDIKWATKELQKLYPDKKFDFVFFEPDGTKKRFEYEKIKVAPGAFRIKSNHFFKDSEYEFNHPTKPEFPHIHVISEMLDNIRLSENAFTLPDSDKN